MIVVIEGPRGSGKSQLVSLTSRALTKLGVPNKVQKFARGGRPHADMAEQIVEMEHFNGQIYLVDRFHMTEWVMRKYDKTVSETWLFERLEMVENLLQIARAAVYVMRVDEPIRLARIEARNDGRGMEMPSEQSVELWNEALKHFPYHGILHNNTTAELQNSLDAVLRAAMRGLK